MPFLPGWGFPSPGKNARKSCTLPRLTAWFPLGGSIFTPEGLIPGRVSDGDLKAGG